MTKRSIFFLALAILFFQADTSIAEVHNQSESIGSYTLGCIENPATLPPNGEGYQVIRLSRDRFYGHPELIAYIESLAEKVSAKLNGTLLIGDLSKDNGGPMPPEHGSHQIGLDADILFWQHPSATKRELSREEREAINPRSLLGSGNSSIDQSKWNPIHGEILKLAASYEDVQRIFVNPHIKKKLCNTYPGEDWLMKVRPWWGHDGHFHVRLRCPEGSLECRPQQPVPAGSGCGSELAWWFSPEARMKEKERDEQKEEAEKKLPERCLKLLSEHGR